MIRLLTIASRSVLALLPGLAIVSAVALATDLSRYRDFQLGSDLSTIAKQAGTSPAQAKVIQRRPALIQELEWRPQPLGPSSRAESVRDGVFSFYNGALFRIAVSYDRYETEGLTAGDFVEAMSPTYGPPETVLSPVNTMQGQYGEQEQIVAQWQDSDYSFSLIRSSYGPSYRLIGVLKRLQASAQIAVAEAKRLDDQEAPQRDAARLADEKSTERAKLEQSRLLNKPKFRP